MRAKPPHLGQPALNAGMETTRRPVNGFLDPSGQHVRVALVDDEEGVHRLFSGIFKKQASQWTLVAYQNATNALRDIPMDPPDAVIMDLMIPGVNGIDCAKKLKRLTPDLPIVMLSGHFDAEMLSQSLMAGACGCLFKPAAPLDIVGAIKKAMAGTLAFCPRAEKTMLEYFANLGKKYDGWELSRREREVLDGIRRQQSDKEIAVILKIAPSTVHVHMASVFKKLKVHTRAEAMMKIMG